MSPTRYTSIGGMDSPRRWARASRSHRSRTRPEVGRNRRSKSRLESTVPTIGPAGWSAGPAPLAAPAERGDHLVERQDQVDVVRLPAQPLGQPGQHLAAPGPQEVVLHVRAREPGVSGTTPPPCSARSGAAGPARCRAGAGRSRCAPSVRPSRRSAGGAGSYGRTCPCSSSAGAAAATSACSAANPWCGGSSPSPTPARRGVGEQDVDTGGRPRSALPRRPAGAAPGPAGPAAASVYWFGPAL